MDQGAELAATVASFSFFTPLLSIGFGWRLLGEPVGVQVLAAGTLVAAGLALISRAPRQSGVVAALASRPAMGHISDKKTG